MQPVLQTVLIVTPYKPETFELRLEAGVLSRQGLWAGRKVEYTSVAVVGKYFISFIIYFVFIFLIT